ncbi:MAG: PadR family transcriptional regulator [Gemmatimonadales bacterium]|nr:PadR family transcriptional regulator [Gemmatimonadales bacterium]
MCGQRKDWGFGEFFSAGFGPKGWAAGFGPRGGRRNQIFESGEVKFVVLRLLKEKPRHGYDVIKGLEERMAGCYTPSAGTVYPTLQLLEDQGYVRVVEAEGKKVYHITPEGERFLEENRDALDEIFDRVRQTVRDFAGGDMGEIHSAFGRLAKVTFGRAWRRGPEHPSLKHVAEILRKAADEIELAWETKK